MSLIQDSIENKNNEMRDSFLYGALGKNKNEQLHEFRD